MARPCKKIDYAMLEELCKIHCTGEECAAILGIDYDTLNNNIERDGHGCFTDYYKKASSEGKMSLRRRQFKAAVEDGSVPMMIWLGKQYLGQMEKVTTDSRQNVNINFSTEPDADTD